MDITPESLAFYDIDMNNVVEPGEFAIMVGRRLEGGSGDGSARGEILNGVRLLTHRSLAVPARERCVRSLTPNGAYERMAKISVTEKVGYSLGDAAANFIFQTMLVFQLAFYTDTFGITAAAAGTLFLIVRVWDAIFDPLRGWSRTGQTRSGESSARGSWTVVLFGIMGFLTYSPLCHSARRKLVYAYVTYIVLMMVYWRTISRIQR